MAVVDSHAAHHDDHHDHGEFIAHHFDSAEQQFDSGKLGIWVFLVTEVLFFSGLFVAYTLYRNHHPEIFEQAHVHLDKFLGGINTVVLLFSSLTMAMAVRSAQLGQNKSCGSYTLVTMVCAAVFLGVKAVEYSHKWDMGIFVRSGFHLHEHTHPKTELGIALGISDYLVYLSILPTVLLVGFIAAAVVLKFNNKSHVSQLMVGLAITVGGYFLGAVGGQIYQNAQGPEKAHASAQPVMVHALTAVSMNDDVVADDHAQEVHAHDASVPAAGGEHGDHLGGHRPKEKLDRDIGTFFSIYYCMTGLHAIHILGGIVALSWIYWRSLLGHWRSDYFGPVDYVGLYWHLVDLIWIYLFPLLYLID